MNNSKSKCRKLDRLKGNQRCVFCKTSEINEFKLGPVYKLDDIITHYYCLLLSSNTKQNGNDKEGILGFLAPDILQEVKRGYRLHCTFCKQSGATLGCAVSRCKKSFHLPCGIANETLHQFFGEFMSFCVNHRLVQQIDESVLAEASKDEAMCVICHEGVIPRPVHATLWAPCCKKAAFFHRNCVQSLALSAGYYFKCPLCNDKDKFTAAMTKFGIFIPNQDASWETEPNAFGDLLVRHDSCDLPTCLCPNGRQTNITGTRWELRLCHLCGSQGVHIGCGKLGWRKKKFTCSTCSSENSNPNVAVPTPSGPGRRKNTLQRSILTAFNANRIEHSSRRINGNEEYEERLTDRLIVQSRLTKVRSRPRSRQRSCAPSRNHPSRYPSWSPSRLQTRRSSSLTSRSPSRERPRRSSRPPSRYPSHSPSRRSSRPTSRQRSRCNSRPPSRSPSRRSSRIPSRLPSRSPSCKRSHRRSRRSSHPPSHYPSRHSSRFPSRLPSHSPSCRSSRYPSRSPSPYPSRLPSRSPSSKRSHRRSRRSSRPPSRFPSNSPSRLPSCHSSLFPSRLPSRSPSCRSSRFPSRLPSHSPSFKRSHQQSRRSSRPPSCFPSNSPSPHPSCPSSYPPSHSSLPVPMPRNRTASLHPSISAHRAVDSNENAGIANVNIPKRIRGRPRKRSLSSKSLDERDSKKIKPCQVVVERHNPGPPNENNSDDDVELSS